jgi:hypothetical protein
MKMNKKNCVGLQIILKSQLNFWNNSRETEMQHKAIKTCLFEFTIYI